MIAAKSHGGAEFQGLRVAGRSPENNGKVNNLFSWPQGDRGECGQEEGGLGGV